MNSVARRWASGGAAASRRTVTREGGNAPLFTLGALRGNPGSRPSAKRVGRGPGSGYGKTAARGHNGQKSRSGRMGRTAFEGGQNPLIKRLPKRGRMRSQQRFPGPYMEVNLDRVMQCVRSGKIDASRTITLKDIHDSGAVGRFRSGVKLLSRGAEAVDTPLNIEVSAISAKAREAVERAGGSVRLVYFNRLGLRVHLHPEKFDVLPKMARPPPRLQDRGLDVYSIEEQLANADRLGKPLNPPHHYADK